MSRGVVAALLAAAVVLSGCGTGDESATTTSPFAEAPVNPWDLPLEERPDLFDPCTEIPVEAIEEAVGGPVEPVDLYTQHQPSSLMVCGWAYEELDLTILSTWKSHSDYLDDPSFAVVDADYEVAGRTAVRATERIGSESRGCILLLFTERGTIWVRSDFIGTFRQYKGERFADPCTALDDIAPEIVRHIPAGDFR